MKTSIVFPHMPSRLDELVPFAQLVDETPAHRLWLGQSLRLEMHQVFAYLAGLGYRIPVATGVALTALRHPLESALHARTLSSVTGDEVVFGIGTGADEVVRSVRGAPYSSPLTVVREYLTVLRELIDGRVVEHQGEYCSMHGSLEKWELPSIELATGVLRPRMAELAGELADVAFTWMTPPGYLWDVIVPRMRAAADSVGRSAPRVATVVHVALRKQEHTPYRMAWNAAQVHLRMPHYVDMLRRSGLMIHHTAPVLGARTLVDSGTFVIGSPEEVATKLVEYERAGVDEIVLNPAGVYQTCGADDAIDDLRRILDVVTSR